MLLCLKCINNEENPFESLPPELWYHIFKHLSAKDVLTAGTSSHMYVLFLSFIERVCTQWYACGSIQNKLLIWKELCFAQWGINDS